MPPVCLLVSFVLMKALTATSKLSAEIPFGFALAFPLAEVEILEVDESFNETIKSRYRDEFTYASFSEGEKQRIDLSLLFTWRQIAKMKNSANTNLLILDETFDSSLDNDGIDNLMKILNTVTNDTNVFIISHKGDVLDSKFRNKIEFIKERNFSRIK